MRNSSPFQSKSWFYRSYRPSLAGLEKVAQDPMIRGRTRRFAR